MRLRVGVIGLGDGWERRYRPALRALRDRFEVRGVYAPVALLSEKAARKFRTNASPGFRHLVRRADIDAVLILSTDWLGPLPILAACDAGKAIFSAANLDVDLQQARSLQQYVERAGVAYMAEFARRHAPATVRLKELIATRLGEPRLLFCHHRAKRGKHVAGRPDQSRNASATHRLLELVDWCCYVVGSKPTSVLGIDHRTAEPGVREDYRMVSVDFSSGEPNGTGPVAQISFGSYLSLQWPEAISFRPPAHLQICCQRGVAFVDLPSTVVWFDEAGRHMESLDNERPVGEQMLIQFHRAVTSLVLKRSDLDDAYRALRTVLTAQQAALEGRRILLD